MAEVKKQLEENWNNRYNELVTYRLQNPGQWPHSASVLGTWSAAQRTAHNGKIRYKLPQHRTDKLNEIGFRW